jgi:hypothetical protein
MNVIESAITALTYNLKISICKGGRGMGACQMVGGPVFFSIFRFLIAFYLSFNYSTK